MTLGEVNQRIDQVSLEIPGLMGSACLDRAAEMISLTSYLKEQAIAQKQKAYKIANNCEGSAAKGDIEMKASDDYMKFLLYDLKGNMCLEMALLLKAKAKGDSREEIAT
jgi:hypothetical protein